MRSKILRLSMLCISITSIFLLNSNNAYAKGIDPEFIVGVWLLDDEDGDIAKDISENSRDGQIKGTESDEGKFDKALNFAKGDTVEIDIGKGTITNKVSVVMWLQFTDISDQQNYFSIWDQSDHRYVPYKTSAHELHFWSNNWDIGSGFIISAKEWYHVANVYDGAKVYIYVNGELRNSQVAANFALSDQQQNAWIATDRGGWISACVIDDVGLFNTDLTEDQVKSIMEKGIAWTLGLVAVEPLGKLPALWGTLKAQN